MSSEEREITRGGLLDKVAGSAKALAGDLTDNAQLAREGRLQQAQVDAESDAVEASADAEAATAIAKPADAETADVETAAEREEISTESEARHAEDRAELARRARYTGAESQATEPIAAAGGRANELDPREGG